jgi:hypothetical protein
MSVTLVLTRTPLKPFHHGQLSGRWGELIAVRGPKVTAVRLSPSGGSNPSSDAAAGSGGIPVGHGILQLSMTGGAVTAAKRFTSMERFKTNDGRGYYVQLHPKPDPYSITFESGNTAVKHLRKGHDGRCFRVHGGKVGPEQGILIHEAPHVGWVIGCISPRPLHNYTHEFQNQPGNPSFVAMNELFEFVGISPAAFFVLDW